MATFSASRITKTQTHGRGYRTGRGWIERGLPKYAVSGVALPKDYARNAQSELELVISAMLKAITEFNARGADQIVRVGMLPDDLSLNKLPPVEVFQRLERIYGEVIGA